MTEKKGGGVDRQNKGLAKLTKKTHFYRKHILESRQKAEDKLTLQYCVNNLKLLSNCTITRK